MPEKVGTDMQPISCGATICEDRDVPYTLETVGANATKISEKGYMKEDVDAKTESVRDSEAAAPPENTVPDGGISAWLCVLGVYVTMNSFPIPWSRILSLYGSRLSFINLQRR